MSANEAFQPPRLAHPCYHCLTPNLQPRKQANLSASALHPHQQQGFRSLRSQQPLNPHSSSLRRLHCRHLLRQRQLRRRPSRHRSNHKRLQSARRSASSVFCLCRPNLLNPRAPYPLALTLDHHLREVTQCFLCRHNLHHYATRTNHLHPLYCPLLHLKHPLLNRSMKRTCWNSCAG